MIYCQSCGRELSDGVSACAFCGRPVAPPSAYPGQRQRVTYKWWLLPLFFTVFGGSLAYFSVKDRDPVMAKRMLAFGVVWGIVVVLMTYR